MSTQFTPGASTAIAHGCTVATLGNNHDLRPSETLGQYGVTNSEQISLIKTRIRENEDIGLPHFGRSIDPNALKDLDTSWTIMKLADVIFDNSFIVAADFEFVTTEAVPQPTTGRTSRSNELMEFTRENPAAALAAAAAVGMMVGFFLGRIIR